MEAHPKLRFHSDRGVARSWAPAQQGVSKLAIHERSEYVGRGPKAEPRASARGTCGGSVGTDAAPTHIDRLDAYARPRLYTIEWITVHAIVYRRDAYE
jgi:hypothetical protein